MPSSRTVGEVTGSEGTVYTLAAHAHDATGHTTDVAVSVTIVTGNLRPTMTSPQVVTLPENSAAGVAASPAVVAVDRDDPAHDITYSLEAWNDTVALELFVIHPTTGVIRVAPAVTADDLAAGALDFETTPRFWVTVKAQDNGPGALAVRGVVTVVLTDVNEPPVCPTTPVPGAVDENAPGGVVVSSVEARCSDVEGEAITFRVDASASAAAAAQFETNVTAPNTFVVVVAANATIDFETTAGHEVQVPVVATDAGGATTTMTVLVTLRDVNEAPVFTPASHALAPTLAEDTAPGTTVLTVHAVDEDDGDVVVYALGGATDRMLFAVDVLTGAVSLVGRLDYESAGVYEVTVVATDPEGLEAELRTALTVSDVHDIAITTLFVTSQGGPPASVPDDASPSSPLPVQMGTVRTVGGTRVTLRGHDLGFAPARRDMVAGGYAPVVVVTYGPTGTEYTATNCTLDADSNQAVACDTVAGVGAAHLWTVTIDGAAASSGALRTSYELPTIATVASAQPLATAGGTPVTVTGTNFGAVGSGATVHAVYGDALYEAACEVTVDHTTMVCTSVEGRGAGQHWRVFVAGQQSAWSPSGQATSYAAPVVTDVEVQARAGDDGDATDGSGGGGGGGGGGVAVSALQQQPQQQQQQQQQEARRRRLEEGDGASATTPRRLDTRGGDTVIVTGSNFGPPPQSSDASERVVVTYGGPHHDRYTATCVFLAPHTQLECVTAPGVGTEHAWVVSVGGVASTPGTSSAGVTRTSYHPPTLTSVSGAGAHFADTSGGQRVVIAGDQFGAAGVAGGGVEAVTYGVNGTEFAAVDCAVSVHHTGVTCLTAPGTGRGHSWRITVGGQVSELLFADTGYGSPIVSHFSGTGAGDGDTRGGEEVVLHGFNFGADIGVITGVEYTLPAVESSGSGDGDGGSGSGDGGGDSNASDEDVLVFTASGCALTVPHETLTCTSAPGAGAALSWRVVVDGQASSNPVTNYAAPRITSLACSTAASTTGAASSAACGQLSTEGGDSVVVTGDMFGPATAPGPFVTAVSYGPTGREYAVTNFTVVSHTTILATTVASMGVGMTWRVVVAGQASELSSATTSTALPRLWSMSPASGDTHVGTTVVLAGSNWGVLDPYTQLHALFGNAADATLRAPVKVLDGQVDGDSGSSSSSSSSSFNDTVATVQVPPGLGAARAMRLRVTVTYPGGNNGNNNNNGNSNNGAEDDGTASSTAVAAAPFVAVTEPLLFDYHAPVLDFVEVSSRFEQSMEELAWVAAHFDAAEMDVVRRLRVIGSNFGPPARELNDTVAREVLLQATDASGTALSGSLSTAGVQVYAWSHTEITAFTTEAYGNVAVRVRSAPFVSGPVLDQTSGTASYADFTPRISALTGGGPDGFATAGGDVMVLTMFHLGSTQTLSISVSNTSCPLVTADNALIADADVRRVVIEEPLDGASPQVDTAWTVRCRVPAGEGSRNPVIVYRNGVASLSEAGGGSTLRYAPPSIGRIMTPVAGGGGGGGANSSSSSSSSSGGSGFEPVVDAAGLPTALVMTTRGGRVRVEGANFGFCPEVTLTVARVGVVATLRYCDGVTGDDITGDATSSPYTVAHSHTALEFDIPPGQGSELFLAIRTASQESDPPLRFGYAPPSVSSVQLVGAGGGGGCGGGGGGGGGGASGAPTAGGTTVVVEGDNFGFNPAGPTLPPTVWFTNDGVASALGALACADVEREAGSWHVRVTCTLPAGGGQGFTAHVQAGDQTGALPDALSFAPPSFTTAEVEVVGAGGGGRRRLAAVTADVNAGDVLVGPTAGGFNVTIAGSNLGHIDVVASGGGGASEVCVVLTDPLVVAPQRVSSGGVAQQQQQQVGVASCAEARAAASSSPSTTVVTDVLRHDHTGVTFVMPAGLGTRRVSVLVYGQAVGTPAAFAYAAPVAFAASPAHGPTDGGTTVTLNGTNFGLPAYLPRQAVQVRFGAQQQPSVGGVVCSAQRTQVCTDEGRECPCDVVLHEDGRLSFTTPGGIGKDLAVVVEVVESGTVVATSSPVYFSYDPPQPVYTLPYEADATGETILIPGRNFGRVADMASWSAEQRRVEVWVNGAECVNAERVMQLGQSVLRCDMQPTTVGFKNLTITVAGQTGHLPAAQEAFYTVCKPGAYGQVSEVCLACPRGASCAGWYAEPLSDPGWYNLNITKDACLPEREHREACNNVLPCEPQFACVGENKCAVGYTSKPPMYRCSSCDVGYYKRAGECAECPDNPLILVLGFVLGASAACVVGYFLNSKQVNLAFVSIGVDYFQVLAMFANSRVKWPALIKDMFHIFSVFNLNLEITAPECSIPDLGYQLKWFFIQSLPLGAAAIFLLLHVAQLLKKRCILGRRKRLNSHLSTMVGMFFTMLYVLYLYLTRTVLDVFDCSPTDPPDGHEYLDVVFERCWEAGGLQMFLLPFACIAMLVYVVGYPATVFAVLHRNRPLVMEDQLLRAKGVGRTRLTNPNAYDFRKRFHKLYYHFRPDRWYWIEVIIARKFFIAFTALMFNKNPAFQLSVALLVMFASCTSRGVGVGVGVGVGLFVVLSLCLFVFVGVGVGMRW